ncbi:MAG: nucleotidyltransferase family protein [Succinatimonas sp.]|nr:nucleotidyltransferase family protein [Succinatimonas sp.]
MILAAGRGERLRPLTDKCPKPLIEVGKRPLIFWHLEKLKACGITEVVVNSAHLSEMIVSSLGDGSAFGMHITHKVEEIPGLETAGGIINAQDVLGDEPFLVINGDIFIDADYSQFIRDIPDDSLAFLFLTSNPPEHLQGDFSLKEGFVCKGGDFTFSGVAIYRPQAFCNLKIERMPLKPLFLKWQESKVLYGVELKGQWFDVGTLDRLHRVESYLKTKE